jgi:ABC-type amino acid transport substrate-binding protein
MNTMHKNTVLSGLMLLSMTASTTCLASEFNITVLADKYPPFIVATPHGLTGPYIEAFNLIMQQNGIALHYKNAPEKRAMLEVSIKKDTCALAVNFDQGESEIIRYVGKVAPITLTAYVRADKPIKLANLADLQHYSTGAINTAEVRDIFGLHNISFTPIERADLAFSMLNAGRFQVVVSDNIPDSVLAQQGARPIKALTIAKIDRWVICNPTMSPLLLNRMRLALREGLLARATLPIWRQYGMASYFNETRLQWFNKP